MSLNAKNGRFITFAFCLGASMHILKCCSYVTKLQSPLGQKILFVCMI